MAFDGGERAVVEAHLGVSQVAVVDEREVRIGGELDAGRRIRDVEVDLAGPDERTILLGEQSDTQSMRTRIRLDDRGALLVEPEGRHSRRLEPRPGPCAQVATGSRLERHEEIIERRVAVGVVAEVRPRSGEEGVLADERDQLLEHRGALGIRDAVEVQLGRLEVRDVRDDRVRRRQLILLVRPGLAAVRERRPRVAESGGRDRDMGSHVVGERLLEPEVIPPRHRHEVAKPHVRHLVEDRVRPRLMLRVRRRSAEDELLRERDEPGILHRAEVVFGNEDLVVLAPRVVDAERVGEEVEPLARDLEDLTMVEVLGE